MVEQVMEYKYSDVNITRLGNQVKKLKTKTKEQQTMLAVWIILSGKTNIWEYKQNQNNILPIMTYVLETRAEI